MTVEVEATDGGVELSTPQELFTTSWIQGPSQVLTAAQASSDGLRFLVAQPLENPLTVPVTVVTNWTAELEQR